MTDEYLQVVIRRALLNLNSAARDQYNRERDVAFGAYCSQTKRNIDSTVNAIEYDCQHGRIPPIQQADAIDSAWSAYYARQRVNQREFHRAIIRSLRAAVALQVTTGE